MSFPSYTCPLTGQKYQHCDKIKFRLADSPAITREGFIVWCASEQWKVLANIYGHGEILPIADEGRAAAANSIRKAT